MLDLECDALILEMFQHFLKAIREHHPEDVFSSMETIMTLVLEENEDISLDLISPLLARQASIKKDNEEVFPIARKFGERVLENCATKLKPYIVQAVKTLDISVDDYSEVLASICKDTSDSLEKMVHVLLGSMWKIRASQQTNQLRSQHKWLKRKQGKLPIPNMLILMGTYFPVVSNGVSCVGEDNALADSKSIKKQDVDCSGHSKDLDISGHEELNDLDAEKVDNNEQKPEQASKRRGWKSSSSTKSAKPPEGQLVANEKEAEKMLDSESHSKEALSSPHEDHFVEKAGPSENDKENHAMISSPKACNDESEVVSSPSSSERLHDENHSKKLGKAKMKDNPAKEEVAEDASKKVSEGPTKSEAKPAKQSVKKALGRNSVVKKTAVEDSVKKGGGAASDAGAKKHSAKKLEKNKKDGGGHWILFKATGGQEKMGAGKS